MSHHHNHLTRQHSRQEDAAQFEAPPSPLPVAVETDPVFLASEAAKLMAGDKAKLDAALSAVPGLTAVLQASNNAGGNSLSNVAAVNFSAGLIVSAVSSVMRFDSNLPVVIRAEHGPNIGIGAAGLDCGGSVIANVQAPGADTDVDTQGARNAAIAAALAPGLTQDVVVAGVTLHFTNGLLTGVS